MQKVVLKGSKHSKALIIHQHDEEWSAVVDTWGSSAPAAVPEKKESQKLKHLFISLAVLILGVLLGFLSLHPG